ncbi:uncharacterized protein LOC141525473 [Cotesia typhae]|uniref:uncharacterized protein LOC141525473 n=1 Tax=Cotesia typhae TaxID=2053667 RepID=UPI003D694538
MISTESYKISTLSWGQSSQQSAAAVQTNSPGPSSSSSSSSSSSTDSDLQKNRFARLPSRPKINIQVGEAENKPVDDVPVLQHSSSRLKKLGERLTVKIPPPEKNSKEEYPALKSSSSSINNFGERLSLKKSNSATFNHEEYPALRSSKRPLQSLSPPPMERSNSLRIPQPKNPHFIRGGSVGSNPSPRSSPGTSWSSLTSPSGLGRSPSSSGSFSSISSSLSSPGRGRTKKLSDLALVPAAPVTVNDQTCKEDGSPAEQCFNFFTFSIFWPPALGYEYLFKNKPVNDNINLLKWSIHGLWPSSYTGAIPENCKKRTSVTFNHHRFQREKGLRTKLETKWFNICPYKQHGCSTTSFWDREFSKHGACASRSSLISSDLGYFKMAVNMMDKVNMAGIFMNSGFKVGDKLTYGEIVDIVNDAIGIRVKVEIVQNKAKNVNYLKEIRVCYNLQFHPINCPGTKLLTQEIRSREIIYLDHVPKLD